MNETWKIGEVATATGLSVKTIRYYTDLHLLSPTVRRSPNGYRLFSSDVINRLAFIKRAQSLGLSLQEIGEILDVHDHNNLPCDVVKQFLSDKVSKINHQIEELVTLKAELQGILSGWQDYSQQQGNLPSICPNIQP